MADLLLCLDSGCGVDLTNNSGRLGASIRVATSRGIKCDSTTRNIYVGTRGFTANADPTSETGCENKLQIDSAGDLWVGPTLDFARLNNAGNNMSVIDWPTSGNQSGDRDSGVVWTNTTNCREVIHWTWESVKVRATADAALGAGEQMICQYELNMIPVFGGGGGVGSAVAIWDNIIADHNAASFNPGSVLRQDTQIAGMAIVNPGGTLSFTGRVDMGTNLNVANAAGDDNGVRFQQLQLHVATGYQRTANAGA